MHRVPLNAKIIFIDLFAMRILLEIKLKFMTIIVYTTALYMQHVSYQANLNTHSLFVTWLCSKFDHIRMWAGLVISE